MNKKEGGAALVLVLLVVALVTVLGVTSVDRIHSSIEGSSNISFKQQSFWYALGVESKASSFIQEIHSKGILFRFCNDIFPSNIKNF